MRLCTSFQPYDSSVDSSHHLSEFKPNDGLAT
jgi:hypothetical protein